MKNIPPQQLHLSTSPSGEDETTIHKPVLLADTVRLLSPKKGQTYLDLTAGYGGHAKHIIDVVGFDHATLVDRDAQAIAYLKPYGEKGASLVQSDFASFATEAVQAGRQYDMVLVDLGVSSPQLDMAERGFSIQRDGPLDMRMDDGLSITADDIVNRSSSSELSHIIESYGEIRSSSANKIAKTIIKNRPIRSTSHLANVILSLHRGRRQRVHPATRTFQAIRIAVNDELAQVEQLMQAVPDILTSGGRIVVISFHSLEDRLVKQRFAELSRSGYEAELDLLTKKPLTGSKNDAHNPRARSAILRGAVKK